MTRRNWRNKSWCADHWKISLSALLLSACATQAPEPPTPSTSARPGAYYLDDGPGNTPPANLDNTPDAVPRVEPYARFANNPYVIMGNRYVPEIADRPFRQRGVASWYGRKFHGQRTSSGEIYDMYGMTAAHPTLPIPSYVRVTHMGNRRSVIVRVNDRGPFLHGRIIDLSYAAAHRLGFVAAGSAEVEVERLLPADISAGRFGPASPTPAGAASVANLPRVNLPSGVSAPAMRSQPEPSVATSTAPTEGPAARAFPVDVPGVAMAVPLLARVEPQSETVARSGPLSSLAPVVAEQVQPRSRDSGSALVLSPRTPSVMPISGYYLQLGAFRQRASADEFVSRLDRQLARLGRTPLQVVSGDDWVRVQLGPYTERVEAESVARRLQEEFDLKSFLVTRP